MGEYKGNRGKKKGRRFEEKLTDLMTHIYIYI